VHAGESIGLDAEGNRLAARDLRAIPGVVQDHPGIVFEWSIAQSDRAGDAGEGVAEPRLSRPTAVVLSDPAPPLMEDLAAKRRNRAVDDETPLGPAQSVANPRRL
jgi:hypothetical protein